MPLEQIARGEMEMLPPFSSREEHFREERERQEATHRRFRALLTELTPEQLARPATPPNPANSFPGLTPPRAPRTLGGPRGIPRPADRPHPSLYRRLPLPGARPERRRPRRRRPVPSLPAGKGPAEHGRLRRWRSRDPRGSGLPTSVASGSRCARTTARNWSTAPPARPAKDSGPSSASWATAPVTTRPWPSPASTPTPWPSTRRSGRRPPAGPFQSRGMSQGYRI